MKTVGTLALCWLLLGCGAPDLKAQILSDATSFSETLWRTEKRKLVLDNMQLTEAEKACFWPLYESYSNAIEFPEGQSLLVISEFNHAKGMSSNDVEKLTVALMEYDLMLAKARKQFYRRLSKALSIEHAARFMEIDDTLRQMLRMKVKAGGTVETGIHASAK